ERVRHGDDLEHAFASQLGVPRAYRRLGDAEARRDPAERLAAVRLERLDDLPVEIVDPAGRRDGAAPPVALVGQPQWVDVGAAQCAEFVALGYALRQWT